MVMGEFVAPYITCPTVNQRGTIFHIQRLGHPRRSHIVVREREGRVGGREREGPGGQRD